MYESTNIFIMEIESSTINSPTTIEEKLLNKVENASVPLFNIKHEDVCISQEESTSETPTNSTVKGSGNKRHKELVTERQDKVVLRKSFEPNSNNILSKRTRYRSNKSIIESAIARKEQYLEPYEKPKNKRRQRLKVGLNNVEMDSKSSSSKLICDNESKSNDLCAKLVENDEISSVRKSPRKIVSDISRGRETNPIQCYNDMDDKYEPRDYSYITKNCVTSDLHVNMNIKAIKPCLCIDRCSSLNCACAKLSLRCWYDDYGKLVPEFNFCEPPLIFECNDLCECNKILCKNRLVQKSLTQMFQLFRTEYKGWGIKSLNFIPLGSYVCEYIGELITNTEAELREDDSYLFDLDNKETDSYVIDAKFYSNFARFINHSCDPNLHPVKVFVDHQDLRFPRIALFAKKCIQAEEELSFDYGEKFWLIKYKSFTCDCRADTCKYSKEAIGQILEKYHMPL